MREQLTGPKVGERVGFAAKNRYRSASQRPARRGRGNAQGSGVKGLRKLVNYVPLFIKIAVGIACGVSLFAGYRTAASASLFRLKRVEVKGTQRASVEAIQTLVRHDVAATGVWRADVKEISAHLERMLWVRSAIVTRVLPDGIRVRISERVPCAVVRLISGHLVWVDEDAVPLGEMQPTDEMPPFFVRGWNEDASDAARTENQERVRKYLELRRLWQELGVADRVSEVNLFDIRDVRAQLTGDDSQIEVRLGSQDLGKRLQQALTVLDAQKKTARGPFLSYVDLTQGKRAIVGFTSGAHTATDESGVPQPAKVTTPRAPASAHADSRPATAKPKPKVEDKKESDKKRVDNSKRDRKR